MFPNQGFPGTVSRHQGWGTSDFLFQRSVRLGTGRTIEEVVADARIFGKLSEAMPSSLLKTPQPARSWVFAYGSNMHQPDLERWFAEHHTHPPTIYQAKPAQLHEYQLSWNYYSKRRQGGAANVVRATNATVWGVAMEVCSLTLDGLDRKEGHPNVYERKPCQLRATDGHNLQAWLYEVTPAFASSSFHPPQTSYLQLLIESARLHQFPESYLESLYQISCVLFEIRLNLSHSNLGFLFL
jgi:cation transport regulator ChaC